MFPIYFVLSDYPSSQVLLRCLAYYFLTTHTLGIIIIMISPLSMLHSSQGIQLNAPLALPVLTTPGLSKPVVPMGHLGMSHVVPAVRPASPILTKCRLPSHWHGQISRPQEAKAASESNCLTPTTRATPTPNPQVTGSISITDASSPFQPRGSRPPSRAEAVESPRSQGDHKASFSPRGHNSGRCWSLPH